MCTTRTAAILLATALTLLLPACRSRGGDAETRGQIPSQHDLENMTYRSGFIRTGVVRLTDGSYQEPIRGNAGMLMVTLSPSFRLTGALNEHQDGAAVILRTVPGSTQRGEFFDLAAVIKTDTAAQNIATASLGNHVKVRSLLLENNRVVIEMLVHAPRDPASRPSLPIRRTYALQHDKLVLLKTDHLEE
jgi:hypothetical protein